VPGFQSGPDDRIHVQYLNAENEILRGWLPKQVTVTRGEAATPQVRPAVRGRHL